MTSIADSREGDYEQSFSSFKAVVTQTNKTVQLPRSYIGGYMVYICPWVSTVYFANYFRSSTTYSFPAISDSLFWSVMPYTPFIDMLNVACQ